MSVIQVRCPGCQSTLRVPSGSAGKKVRCSQCQTVLAIPAAPASANQSSAPPQQRPQPQQPFTASAPVSTFSTTPSFAQSPFTQPGQPSPASPPATETNVRPGWMVPAIVLGVAMVLCMIGGGIFMLTRFNRSVVDAVNETRAAEADARSQQAAAAQKQLAQAAAANPLPDQWQSQSARGVSVRMPADASIREINSPIQGGLMLRLSASQPDNGADVWLTEMPIPAESEVKRDQWLRNMFHYSGGQPREVVDVVRDGKSGTRIVLERDGDRKDPLMEVFLLPERMVVVSVQPAGSKFDEAFFASLQFPSKAPTAPQVASTDVPTSDPDTQPTGDEARRKRIYLEYKEYASANSSRVALPGIKARDAIDKLVNQVNENQVQAFLQIHNLSERELNDIIKEGTSKNWQPPR
ncbi:MAG: hypothetical protein R3C05_24625 [Pirellulaceae bacterium]